MGAIAALVLVAFVVVMLIVAMVAEVRQRRNIDRSSTEKDRNADRLAA
jgi:heme exporter protein D